MALTAHILGSNYAMAAEVGCNGFLAQPCAPHCVVEEVERLLRLSPTDAQR